MKRNILKQQINDIGHRLTKQREYIYAIIKKAKQPLAASEIINTLNRNALQADKATVYRNLEFLLDQKLVKKVKLKDGINRYELNKEDHHHHLICSKCKKIIHFEIPKLEAEIIKLENKIKRSFNFTPTEHVLDIYGYCKNCQK